MANVVMLKGSLQLVGRHLGTRTDPAHDEQPGRVIQQMKRSPLALLGVNPFVRYYGDYAGPGMFVIAACWHFTQTGDKAFIRHLMPQLDAVLGWIDTHADLDGDGFYEYETHQSDARGKNQGWMDSPEALLDEDGRLLKNPIAVAEIQGYYYTAKQLLGLVLMFLGDVGRGTELLAQAQDLKRRFNAAFWLPESRCFAQALGPDKRPVRNVASNMGHCLACGIVDADKAASVAGRLMAPDMFSGWGIRTLSADHPAYNPFAYHLGSVWPSENATIALGFKRYGLNGLLHELARGMFDATRLFDQQRLPEAIGGYPRDRAHPHPGIYPQSNAPQSWSSSAIVMLVQALAGVLPLAPIRTLLIDPDLPDWLSELTLKDLRIGEARVSLAFKRDASGHTDYRILEKSGRLHVLRQAPPNSLTAHPSDRVGDALGSLLGRH
jgi:glycogen debranching enzyme